MLAFFGTSRHSSQFLEQVTEQGLKVDLVVSSPPKPVGKKQILTENPTVTAAKKLNLSSLSDLSNLSSLGDLSLGLILDYNVIIHKEIIDLFPKGIINIHFSRLPQYRGAAPVQYTILNGDKDAWITYYLIDEKLDTGKIITQTSIPLDLTETTESLYRKLIAKTAKEIREVIDGYLCDRYHTCQQTGEASYAKKLKTENCQIDWTKSPIEIERLIRAAYPEPGAWTMVEMHSNSSSPSSRACRGIAFPPEEERDSSTPPIGIGVGRNDKLSRLKIHKAHLENEKLVLDLVQLEGKNPVTWKQFQQGYPKFVLL